MTTNGSFQEHTKQTILAFLNSALVVDEEASNGQTRTQPTEGLISPGRGAPALHDSSFSHDSSLTYARNGHELLTQKIIDAFADKGVICGVFRPDGASGWTKRVLKAAEKADIVILDWNLKVSDSETGIDETAVNAGEHAVKIISDLATKDFDSGRLRMIAIYTAESKPNGDLLGRIRRGLDKIAKKHNIDLILSESEGILRAGPISIAIVRKSGINGSTLEQRSESELPDYLIDVLAQQNNGLLMNAAISAVSALRHNTFQLINLFSDQLDAAFVAHRIGLKTPEEAEEHFISVIVSDLQEILESSNVAERLKTDALLNWADSLHKRKMIGERFFDVGFDDARDTLRYLLNKGLPAIDDATNNDDNLNNKVVAWAKTGKNNNKKRLSKIAAQFTDEARAEESHRLWTKRISIRSHFGDPAPFMRPGTLIRTRNADSSEYFVCVQPACDCRRIPSSGKNFIFLPASIIVEDKKSDICLHFKDEWLQLKVTSEAYEIRKILLVPNAQDDVIRAYKEGSNDWFFVGFDKTHYQWLGTLKPFHAQQIIHNLANKISRIGIEESEWYRSSK